MSDQPEAEQDPATTGALFAHPAVSAATYYTGHALRVVLIAGVTIATYKAFFEPRVVTVDLQKIISAEIESAQKRGMSDEDRAASADRFGRALETALDEAADGGRNLVLVSPAVVRGGEDNTDVVHAQVRALMGQSR